MLLTAAVTVATGLGAACRVALDRAVRARTRGDLPYGTAVVNVLGSFVLGLVLGLSGRHGLAGPVVEIVGTGFAGGFTTLSTWAWETLTLLDAGRRRGAAAYALGSLASGLLAAAAGLGLARL